MWLGVLKSWSWPRRRHSVSFRQCLSAGMHLEPRNIIMSSHQLGWRKKMGCFRRAPYNGQALYLSGHCTVLCFTANVVAASAIDLIVA